MTMPERKRIGLLVPSNNSTVEPDFSNAVPRSVSVHSHHLWSDIDPRRPARTEKLGDEFLQATRFLTPMKLGALALAQGNAASEEQFTRIFEIPAVASSPSVVQALRYYGAQRVAVFTPYNEYVNSRLWEYFSNFRFEVVGSFGDPRMTQNNLQDTNLQEPAEIAAFVTSTCPSDADALVLSGSAWRSMEAAAEIEQATGKLVVTTNQATIWRAVRKLGVIEGTPGWGRLIAEMPPIEDEPDSMDAQAAGQIAVTG
jgi:maleate isomerase